MADPSLLGSQLAAGSVARAALTLIAIGISTGTLGCVLMVRRLALLTDVLSHAMLPGVGVAWLLAGVSVPALLGGALAAGVVTAVGSGLISRFTVLAEDAASAAMFSTMFAGGLLLVAATGGSEELLHLLAGDVLGVGTVEVVLACLLASATVLFLAACHRGIVMECFDPEFHRACGGSGAAIHLTTLALVVVALVVSLRAVGAVLSIGLFMLPAATAALWFRRWEQRVTAAPIIAAIGSLGGLALACHNHLPPGPCIVTSLGAVFVVSLLFLPVRRLRRRHQPHHQEDSDQRCELPPRL